ncbi:MAG: ribonuclease HI [Bacteroidia bacterium]|nr:ribonuclease HI [Bacteroidia bacterium]
MSAEKELIIYTDGAALGNPGKGGYGIVMMWGTQRKEIAEGFEFTTNNRMELLAVIIALEAVKRPDIGIHIYTDSKYVHDAIEKKWVFGWQKTGFKNKKNIDLWKRFLLTYPKHKVKLHWVKGHAGIKENERCDQLATSAASKGPWLKDHGYIAESNSSKLL